MADELTEKERRLFYILESIPYAVITTDPEGRITTFNRGAEKLTLFRREEVIGKPIFDLPLKRHKEEFVSWKTLREGRAFEEVESYLFDKEKKKHDVRIYSSLFRGGDDKTIGAIVVIRDVGEIKQLERYLKQSERLASLGQLTAGIAHEIKNPLSIIQAAVEAIRLEMDQTPVNRKEIDELTGGHPGNGTAHEPAAHRFPDAGQRKGKPPAGNDRSGHRNRGIHRPDPQKVQRPGNRGAGRLQDGRRLGSGGQGPSGPGLPQHRAEQPPGDGRRGGRFHLRLLEKENVWQIEIEDTGKGIPESQIQWIFDPLFSTKAEGTGMGLAIAHEIISRHNGRIWASSTVHKGTTLFIQLPKGRREEKSS